MGMITQELNMLQRMIDLLYKDDDPSRALRDVEMFMHKLGDQDLPTTVDRVVLMRMRRYSIPYMTFPQSDPSPPYPLSEIYTSPSPPPPPPP